MLNGVYTLEDFYQDTAPHFPVAVHARLFGKTERVAQLAAERGWLGPPKISGKRKVYSVLAAENLWGRTTTAAQRNEAQRTERDERLAKIAHAVRQLRDREWDQYLLDQGILGFTAPPATKISLEDF